MYNTPCIPLPQRKRVRRALLLTAILACNRHSQGTISKMEFRSSLRKLMPESNVADIDQLVQLRVTEPKSLHHATEPLTTTSPRSC